MPQQVTKPGDRRGPLGADVAQHTDDRVALLEHPASAVEEDRPGVREAHAPAASVQQCAAGKSLKALDPLGDRRAADAQRLPGGGQGPFLRTDGKRFELGQLGRANGCGERHQRSTRSTEMEPAVSDEGNDWLSIARSEQPI